MWSSFGLPSRELTRGSGQGGPHQHQEKAANLNQELKKLEPSLREAADQLRANSKLNASEYSMPVLGLIFLRHATNRFDATQGNRHPGEGLGKAAQLWWPHP